MAYQRKTKKIGSNTKFTHTVHSDGSQRFTTTQKTGNITRSRSSNKDGSVRHTTTQRLGGGWVDRKTTTTGKGSKTRVPKPLKTKRSRNNSGAEGIGILIGSIFILIIGVFRGLFWLFRWVWSKFNQK